MIDTIFLQNAYPRPFPHRPSKHDLSTWKVVEDWLDPASITEAEVTVFERWFGDILLRRQWRKARLFMPFAWKGKLTTP